MYPHHVFHAELAADLHRSRMQAAARAHRPEPAAPPQRQSRRRRRGHRLRLAGLPGRGG